MPRTTRTSQRTRIHNDKRFNINNIKKGAEKRAHDDFYSSLKNITGVNIDGSLASDLSEIAQSTNKMAKELVNGNINQIKNAVVRSTSNEGRSNAAENFIGISKLGFVLMSNTGVAIKNKETMNKMVNVEKSVFNKSNLEQLNNTLIDAKTIVPEDKLKINPNDIFKSFKRIERKLDVYSSKEIGYDISKVSTQKLIGLLKEAKKSGNLSRVNVIETQIGINELTRVKSPSIRKKAGMKYKVKRLVNLNVDNETLSGYNTLNNYRVMTNTLVKGTKIYYKGLGKGFIKSGDLLYRGGVFTLDKVGLHKASQKMLDVRSNVQLTNKKISNKIKDNKIKWRNRREQMPGNIKHGVAEAGRATGRVAQAGAKSVGSKVQSTNAYRKVSGATQRTYSKVVNSKFGRATSRVNRVGRKVTKVVTPKAKKVLSIPGKMFSIPIKLTKGAVGTLFKGLNAFNLMAKKAIAVVGTVMISIAIISSAFVGIIAAISTVGDAVSNTLEDFKTKTTMGATYSKLLEKEQEFNSAVMNLPNTIGVPNDYSIYGITKYTNVNVHYLGADGKEISWSGALGDVNIDPSEVTDSVWSYMKRKGWSDIAIAGLLGNMQQESSFRVTCLESSSDNGSASVLNSGYGLCQWTNTQGNTTGRRHGLFQYAASHGGAPSDIKMQLDYLLYGEGSDSSIAREYGRKNFSSVAEATEYFCNKWERPKAATAHISDVRIPAAQNFYNYYTNNPEFSNIEADASEEDISDDDVIIASGYSTADTTTIKGILSMAAVYIEQDFNKYGAYTDGIFADSVYKDYCAKLYDSSHIIGIDQTSPVVYYCPAYSSSESEPQYHVATDACNNKIPAGMSETDWLNSAIGPNRATSLLVKNERDSYETEDSEGKKQTHYYDRYTIIDHGPHGAEHYTVSRGDDDRAQTARDARERFLSTGCKNFTWLVTDKGDGYTDYVYVCKCAECRGHIDAEAYVFVGNIYDPTYEVETEVVDNGVTEGIDGEEDNTSGSTNGNGEAFDHVEKKDQEYKYSLYALDKYATAFDNPDNGSRWVYCTNEECSHYLHDYDGYTESTVSMVEITGEDSTCPECGTELEYPVSGRPGDQESVDLANATSNRAAEQYVMEDLTGLPIKVVDWWKNEGWYNSLSTTKTYFRLPDLENSIDTLEKPVDGGNDEEKDYNVVNKSNSTPYWFNAFTSKSGRNVEFEKHGWDNDSITSVRLLMANDWTDLYGIKDFGYVQGAPMTSAQIAQIIANNPDWSELPLWRQRVLAVCSSLRPGHPYVWSGKAASPGLPVGGLDCSGFTQWAYWTATGVKLGGSTGEQSQTDVNSGKLVQISASELLPGDIAFKFIGGSSSQSNSNHVGIYAGKVNGIPVWCHESGSTAGYKFKAPYANFTVYYRLSPDLVDDNEFSVTDESVE